MPDILSSMDFEDIKDPNFLGVFSKDHFPKRLENGQSIIVNLDDSDGPGTHWVSALKKNNMSFYFDSFGMPPPENIKSILKLYKTPLYYNTSQLQAIDSDRCGWYAKNFIKHVLSSNKIGIEAVYDFLYSYSQSPSQKNEKQVKK